MADIEEQPSPTRNNYTPIWDLIIQDILQRDATGIKTYGVRLQPHNGRKALQDMYFEQLDSLVYLRQQIEEFDDQVTVYIALTKILRGQGYRIYLSWDRDVYTVQIIDAKIMTVISQGMDNNLAEALKKGLDKISPP